VDSPGGNAASRGIVEYRFDFDADGIIDYSTLDDTPPETTSAGKAVEIVPGAEPGIVTARFLKGDKEYMYPSVVAVDEAGLESHPGTAKLGVSYWERELLYETDGTQKIYTLGFGVRGLSVDPATGQVVAYGDSRDPSNETGGLHVAWRNGPDDWRVETVIEFPDPLLYLGEGVPWGTIHCDYELSWNHLNQPIFLFKLAYGGFSGWGYRLFMAERDPGGEWSIQTYSDGKSPDYLYTGVSLESGFIAFRINVRAPGDLYERQLLWYDHGEWSTEDTGYDSGEYWMFSPVTVSPESNLVSIVKPSLDGGKTAVWIATRLGPGDWSFERLDNGEFDQLGSCNYFLCRPEFTKDGALYFSAIRYIEQKYSPPSEAYMGMRNGAALEFWKTRSDVVGIGASRIYDKGIAVTSYPVTASQPDLAMCVAYFDRLENGVLYQEYAFYEPKEIGVKGGATISSPVCDPNGIWYAKVKYTPIKETTPWARWSFLVRRVDPKE